MNELDRLRRAVTVVRTLHSERKFSGDGYGWSVCGECRQVWPCETETMLAQSLVAEAPDAWTAAYEARVAHEQTQP